MVGIGFGNCKFSSLIIDILWEISVSVAPYPKMRWNREYFKSLSYSAHKYYCHNDFKCGLKSLIIFIFYKSNAFFNVGIEFSPDFYVSLILNSVDGLDTIMKLYFGGINGFNLLVKIPCVQLDNFIFKNEIK